MRRFNVTGLCVPEKHYMVDIGEKLNGIAKMVERGDYFTINRPRQYGKTTTLHMLAKSLLKEYTCINLSFEGLGDSMYASSASFCQFFLLHISKTLKKTDSDFAAQWINESVTDFYLLGYHIDELCKDRKIVLMIDEVDKTSNNQVFLHFLGLLRSKFQGNQAGEANTFHSVILAGVYDVRNIKLKMMSEGAYSAAAVENKIYNSPWNIAASFDIDMSFSPKDISSMLEQYEADYGTGMVVSEIAEEIFSYTGGYPFLTTRICQCIDGQLGKNWTAAGVQEAVGILLTENNTLFDDVFKNLENSSELYEFIRSLLIDGKSRHYVIQNPVIASGVRYGFLIQRNGRAAVSNRIFELLMTDYFISKDLNFKKDLNGITHSGIVHNGKFNMELCLIKFAEHYAEVFNDGDIEFLEKHGRLVFLSFLKPLINGGGFYHIESGLTDLRRMDLVVDYGKEQFIIELKKWRGAQYEEGAFAQLCGYLDSKRADTGYLLTFDFRKAENKTTKAEWVEAHGKRIFTVTV